VDRMKQSNHGLKAVDKSVRATQARKRLSRFLSMAFIYAGDDRSFP
jgi:hypothetical protein